METFITIIGVVMILEGVPYFAMPDHVKIVAEKLITLESRTLRLIGFALMIGGLMMVALVRIW